MSVSSHLTPEPERRLWIILENTRGVVHWTDARLAALCLLCGFELALAPRAGGLGAGSLAAAVVLGVAALSPLAEAKRGLPALQPGLGNTSAADALIVPEDLVKYSFGELVHRLDKYLGGGITSTQYYEDIVSQILGAARTAVRKRRLLAVMSALAALGQLVWLTSIIR